MTPMPYEITGTELVAHDALPSMRRLGWATQADAIEEWLRFHGLDPMAIVLNGEPLVRDVERCQIRYPALATSPVRSLDVATVTVVEQGEAPPLPFPSLLFEHPHTDSGPPSPGTVAVPSG